MSSLSAFSRSALLVSTIAMALSGCGPEVPVEGGEVEKEALGVTSQGIAYGGHDYLFVRTPKTWQEAQAFCSINGSKLVTLNDASEQDFVATSAMATGQLSNWWIGLSDVVIEGSFVWDGPSSSYTNFLPGQPDNFWNEDCVAAQMDGGGNGKWHDYVCSVAYPFICERDPAPSSNRGSFSYSASNTNSASTGTTNHSVYLYANQLVTVGTCGVPGASGSGDTYLRVNNPTGQEIASSDDTYGACGSLSNLTFIAPTTGSYTLRAGCFGSSFCTGTVAYNY